MIYLDHSSATFVEESVLETFIQVEKQTYANPDSLHSLGMEMQKLSMTARQKIADLLKVAENEIIFTSGASEANSLAIVGYYQKYHHKGRHILVACGEHSSTKNALASLNAEVEEIPLDSNGNLDLAILETKIRPDTILVCVSAVQNELGSLRDIEQIGHLLRQKGVTFFVDAVQLVGKEPFNFEYADLISISAHKLHGLKGIGVLIKKKHLQLAPIIFGGQQEFGLRGGTSSVALQVAFAKALRLAIDHQKQYSEHIKTLNTYLKQELLQIPEIQLNSNEHCSNYIINFSCKILPSQVMLNAFNQEKIYLSAVSTCVTKRNYDTALRCISDDQQVINGVLRVSLSYRNTLTELQMFIKTLKSIIAKYHVK